MDNLFEKLGRILNPTSPQESTPPTQVGNVRWDFRGNYPGAYGAGLVTGLDQIRPLLGDKVLASQATRSLWFFCRDAAVAASNPNAPERRSVLNSGNQLVESGYITPEQLNYIYDQFGLDTNNLPPQLNQSK